MATPGQLVQTMANVLGIPAATVAQYDRLLAEAGLRTTGGRGTSAAKVTAVDAANLLIAVLGSPLSGPSIKAAKQTCDTFGSLPLQSDFLDSHRHKSRQFGLFSLADLPKKHTFRDALASLIQGASRGETFQVIQNGNAFPETERYYSSVTVQSTDPWAEILFDGSIGYDDPREMVRLTYLTFSPGMIASDLVQNRTITFRTLHLLGDLITGGKVEHASS